MTDETETPDAPDSILIVDSYEVDEFLKIDDVFDLAKEMVPVEKLSVGDVRVLFKSLQIKADRKYRKEGAKGKPSNLYSVEKVEKFLTFWSGWFDA